jgi:hypothetical protein
VNEPIQWNQFPGLQIWDAVVLIGDTRRYLALHRHGDRPDRFSFFCGPGSGPYIYGPTLERAQHDAAEWLAAERSRTTRATP